MLDFQTKIPFIKIQNSFFRTKYKNFYYIFPNLILYYFILIRQLLVKLIQPLKYNIKLLKKPFSNKRKQTEDVIK